MKLLNTKNNMTDYNFELFVNKPEPVRLAVYVTPGKQFFLSAGSRDLIESWVYVDLLFDSINRVVAIRKSSDVNGVLIKPRTSTGQRYINASAFVNRYNIKRGVAFDAFFNNEMLVFNVGSE